MTNPDTPPGGEVFPATINGFFKKTSWNQFSWVGDVGGQGGIGASGGWLTLPHPKSCYADGKTDITVWRPSTGVWYSLSSASPGTYTSIQWGLALTPFHAALYSFYRWL